RALSASGLCTSCIDVTDGVGQSLREVAQASSVCLEIEVETLPIHPVTRKVAHFLNCPLETIVFGIGLDLELLGTLRRQSIDHFTSELHFMGQVVEGDSGVSLNYGSRRTVLPDLGWQHFKGA